MAFSTPYTFTALETLTAAKLNTIQSNITALWPYTTAGDTPYASSSTVLTRLAIGASGTFKKSTGSAPSWANILASDVGKKVCTVHKSTDMTLPTPNFTVTDVTFDTEDLDTEGWHSTVSNTNRITPLIAGYYDVEFVAYSGSGAGGVSVYKNNTTLLHSDTLVNGSMVRIGRQNVLMNGSTDYFNVSGFPTGGANLVLSFQSGWSPYLTVRLAGV